MSAPSLPSLPPFLPLSLPVCALHLQALSHYILCLYRGFDGLVAIGYFAIVPTNSAEMLLGTGVQFIAIW